MEKSSFFTSLNGDRKYKSSDFAEYFKTFIGNGIFPNPSTNLQVIANGDMTLTISPGYAWINGYMYSNTENLTLTITAPDSTLKRIDRIVVRLDFVNRNITTKVKKGTFASSPVAPGLQRDADIYELGIANVFVSNGAVAITQANITDTRLDNSLCGIASSLIDIDIDLLTNRLTEDFNAWFEDIKGILDGDVAGNLAIRIKALEDLVGSGLTADNITIKDTNNNFTANNVEGALNELFINVSNGKGIIASAITDKGVDTLASDSFTKMGTNIGKLVSFPKWAIGKNIPLSTFSAGNTNYTNSLLVEGKIYLNRNGNMYVYDMITDTITSKASNSNVSVYKNMVNYKTNIYLLGYGNTSTYCYDILTNSWSEKTKCTTSSNYGTCAFKDENAYIISGTDNDGYFLKTLRQYNMITDTWTTLKPFDMPGGQASYNFSVGQACIVGDYLYFYYGSKYTTSPAYSYAFRKYNLKDQNAAIISISHDSVFPTSSSYFYMLNYGNNILIRNGKSSTLYDVNTGIYTPKNVYFANDVYDNSVIITDKFMYGFGKNPSTLNSYTIIQEN